MTVASTGCVRRAKGEAVASDSGLRAARFDPSATRSVPARSAYTRMREGHSESALAMMALLQWPVRAVTVVSAAKRRRDGYILQTDSRSRVREALPWPRVAGGTGAAAKTRQRPPSRPRIVRPLASCIEAVMHLEQQLAVIFSEGVVASEMCGEARTALTADYAHAPRSPSSAAAWLQQSLRLAPRRSLHSCCRGATEYASAVQIRCAHSTGALVVRRATESAVDEAARPLGQLPARRLGNGRTGNRVGDFGRSIEVAVPFRSFFDFVLKPKRAPVGVFEQ